MRRSTCPRSVSAPRRCSTLGTPGHRLRRPSPQPLSRRERGSGDARCESTRRLESQAKTIGPPARDRRPQARPSPSANADDGEWALGRRLRRSPYSCRIACRRHSALVPTATGVARPIPTPRPEGEERNAPLPRQARALVRGARGEVGLHQPALATRPFFNETGQHALCLSAASPPKPAENPCAMRGCRSRADG